jgi:hypothetical protein
MSATTKTMIARPTAAMKYSARERPRRRRLMARSYSKESAAP